MSVQAAFAETVNGACVAFGMVSVMQRAAAKALIEHAQGEPLRSVVPRLVSGEWAATICISGVRIWNSTLSPPGPMTVVCRDWYILAFGRAM